MRREVKPDALAGLQAADPASTATAAPPSTSHPAAPPSLEILPAMDPNIQHQLQQQLQQQQQQKALLLAHLVRAQSQAHRGEGEDAATAAARAILTLIGPSLAAAAALQLSVPPAASTSPLHLVPQQGEGGQGQQPHTNRDGGAVTGAELASLVGLMQRTRQWPAQGGAPWSQREQQQQGEAAAADVRGGPEAAAPPASPSLAQRPHSSAEPLLPHLQLPSQQQPPPRWDSVRAPIPSALPAAWPHAALLDPQLQRALHGDSASGGRPRGPSTHSQHPSAAATVCPALHAPPATSTSRLAPSLPSSALTGGQSLLQQLAGRWSQQPGAVNQRRRQQRQQTGEEEEGERKEDGGEEEGEGGGPKSEPTHSSGASGSGSGRTADSRTVLSGSGSGSAVMPCTTGEGGGKGAGRGSAELPGRSGSGEVRRVQQHGVATAAAAGRSEGGKPGVEAGDDSDVCDPRVRLTRAMSYNHQAPLLTAAWCHDGGGWLPGLASEWGEGEVDAEVLLGPGRGADSTMQDTPAMQGKCEEVSEPGQQQQRQPPNNSQLPQQRHRHRHKQPPQRALSTEYDMDCEPSWDEQLAPSRPGSRSVQGPAEAAAGGKGRSGPHASVLSLAACPSADLIPQPLPNRLSLMRLQHPPYLQHSTQQRSNSPRTAAAEAPPPEGGLPPVTYKLQQPRGAADSPWGPQREEGAAQAGDMEMCGGGGSNREPTRGTDGGGAPCTEDGSGPGSRRDRGGGSAEPTRPQMDGGRPAGQSLNSVAAELRAKVAAAALGGASHGSASQRMGSLPAAMYGSSVGSGGGASGGGGHKRGLADASWQQQADGSPSNGGGDGGGGGGGVSGFRDGREGGPKHRHFSAPQTSMRPSSGSGCGSAIPGSGEGLGGPAAASPGAPGPSNTLTAGGEARGSPGPGGGFPPRGNHSQSRQLSYRPHVGELTQRHNDGGGGRWGWQPPTTGGSAVHNSQSRLAAAGRQSKRHCTDDATSQDMAGGGDEECSRPSRSGPTGRRCRTEQQVDSRDRGAGPGSRSSQGSETDGPVGEEEGRGSGGSGSGGASGSGSGSRGGTERGLDGGGGGSGASRVTVGLGASGAAGGAGAGDTSSPVPHAAVFASSIGGPTDMDADAAVTLSMLLRPPQSGTANTLHPQPLTDRSCTERLPRAAFSLLGAPTHRLAAAAATTGSREHQPGPRPRGSESPSRRSSLRGGMTPAEPHRTSRGPWASAAGTHTRRSSPVHSGAGGGGSSQARVDCAVRRPHGTPSEAVRRGVLDGLTAGGEDGSEEDSGSGGGDPQAPTHGTTADSPPHLLRARSRSGGSGQPASKQAPSQPTSLQRAHSDFGVAPSAAAAANSVVASEHSDSPDAPLDGGGGEHTATRADVTTTFGLTLGGPTGTVGGASTGTGSGIGAGSATATAAATAATAAAVASDGPRLGKRPRMLWTHELHVRFMTVVAQLGVETAVPKNILTLMGVDGMTRENVASHLQKYRLYLRRLAGVPANSPIPPALVDSVQLQAMRTHMLKHQQQVHQAAALKALQAMRPGGAPSGPLPQSALGGGGGQSAAGALQQATTTVGQQVAGAPPSNQMFGGGLGLAGLSPQLHLHLQLAAAAQSGGGIAAAGGVGGGLSGVSPFDTGLVAGQLGGGGSGAVQSPGPGAGARSEEGGNAAAVQGPGLDAPAAAGPGIVGLSAAGLLALSAYQQQQQQQSLTPLQQQQPLVATWQMLQQWQAQQQLAALMALSQNQQQQQQQQLLIRYQQLQQEQQQQHWQQLQQWQAAQQQQQQQQLVQGLAALQEQQQQAGAPSCVSLLLPTAGYSASVLPPALSSDQDHTLAPRQPSQTAPQSPQGATQLTGGTHTQSAALPLGTLMQYTGGSGGGGDTAGTAVEAAATAASTLPSAAQYGMYGMYGTTRGMGYGSGNPAEGVATVDAVPAGAPGGLTSYGGAVPGSDTTASAVAAMHHHAAQQQAVQAQYLLQQQLHAAQQVGAGGGVGLSVLGQLAGYGAGLAVGGGLGAMGLPAFATSTQQQQQQAALLTAWEQQQPHLTAAAVESPWSTGTLGLATAGGGDTLYGASLPYAAAVGSWGQSLSQQHYPNSHTVQQLAGLQLPAQGADGGGGGGRNTAASTYGSQAPCRPVETGGGGAAGRGPPAVRVPGPSSSGSGSGLPGVDGEPPDVLSSGSLEFQLPQLAALIAAGAATGTSGAGGGPGGSAQSPASF